MKNTTAEMSTAVEKFSSNMGITMNTLVPRTHQNACFVGTFLGLHGTENLCDGEHQRAFRYLGRLELYAGDAHPTACSVGAFSEKQHQEEHEHGDDEQRKGGNLEVFARHIEHTDHGTDAHQDEERVLHDREPVASALVYKE